MPKFMDTLGALSDSGSDAEEEKGTAEDVPAQPATKKKRAAALEPAPEELERLGYQAGPSILYVPEPVSEAATNWDWGKGLKEDKASVPQEESFEEREHTRNAAGTKLETSARLQRLAHEQARRVRDEAREEQQRLAAERRLTFKQKEKRKRELGQAKGGKGNYVEEEKRIARQFGVYSGFDN